MKTSDDDGQDVWETLANKDPLWAACTNGKRHFDWRYDEFLATGEREVAWASHSAQESHVYPIRRSLAVDFGCGPGRLIGALKERFQQVVGIDTSRTMLSLARRTHPEDNVSFSESTHTVRDGCADLVYSTFVLQHLTQNQMNQCFREFARILHPNGLLIFQYPARPRTTLSGIAFLLLPTSILNVIQRNVLRYPGLMPMSWAAPEKVIRRAAACGLTILEYKAGPKYSRNWKDVWYFASKSSFRSHS
ncbi:class I SAM-dependent methyltransferase [Streptomyces europaeiscabiei]|uniref:class I SAM-dependent methyltransferase n=1 Tax=Streptomyces europaeiscabiei TaxID=146819 RepID=UPI000E67E6A2|nr:class I SAM-dependent methyltransferase [Streptomyces europaeiscabiei]